MTGRERARLYAVLSSCDLCHAVPGELCRQKRGLGHTWSLHFTRGLAIQKRRKADPDCDARYRQLARQMEKQRLQSIATEGDELLY